MNRKNHILSITFLLLLGGISIANACTPTKGFSEKENRYLAKFPALSRESILNGKFTEGFETYTTDQFPLRDDFIRLNVMTHRLMGKKDTNDVYFGKDGYLLEKVTHVDEVQLEKNTEHLESFFLDLASQNIGATAIIAPTAPYILGDKLPAFGNQYDQGKLLATLGDTLGDHFLDLTPTFLARNEDDLYYRTDHHWTTTGAFYAYEAFCKKNNLPLPKIEDYDVTVVDDSFFGTIHTKVPLPNQAPDQLLRFVADDGFQVTHDLTETSQSLYKESALTTRDKYTYYLGGNHAITRIETGIANGQHILVIKDSFAHSFVPFLTGGYETITMIDYRYFNGSTQSLIAQEGINHVLVLYNAIQFGGGGDFYKIAK